MRHLDSDTKTAINRLRSVLQHKTIKFGVFNNVLDIEKTGSVVSSSVSEACVDGLYSETDSNIALDITYVTAKTNMVNQPECPQQSMHLLLLPTTADKTFPEMVEVKMFGSCGKPSTVGVNKDTGDVYLVYVFDKEIQFLHFGTLSQMDKEFVVSDDNMTTPYEFGIFKAALYRFITRDNGWDNLRNSMYIQFNLSPIVRMAVGNEPDDN